MKIRLTTHQTIESERHAPGEVVELPDDLARTLLDIGAADVVPVEPQAEPRPPVQEGEQKPRFRAPRRRVQASAEQEIEP